jgi:hypothetical protein
VVPGDNNFAGVGAFISGKPGERFKDVDTGVLAHLQHVLMYSTTRIPEPVAKRTRQVQEYVQEAMRRLHRPVTYSDLAREWTGSDKNRYAADMQRMAEKYASRYCREAALKPHVIQAVASGAHKHARVIAGTVRALPALPLRTECEAKKMPLLFYFPLIVWMGMMEIAHDEMRVPLKVKTPVRR